jgi:hypothetical protein
VAISAQCLPGQTTRRLRQNRFLEPEAFDTPLKRKPGNASFRKGITGLFLL